MGFNRHNSAIVTKKQINRKNKLRVVFDENARKDFLTGFRKRKDERRKKAKEQIKLNLKNEIKKIKSESRTKLDKVKVSKAHSIVPEIAHLINSEAADVSFTDFGTHSVAVTTLDSLEKVAAPWRNAANTV
jgi:ribosomal RNA-processing protein 17